MKGGMPVKMRRSDFLACGIGIASAAIIFVLLVFDGVRVSAANNVLFLAALAINFLGFALAALERSKELMILSALFSVALVLAVVWGTMECFCIGGGCSSRFENCSGTRTPYVGLLNASILAFHRAQGFVLTVVSVLFALPALAWFVQADQSRAIRNALASSDFRDGCLIQVDDLNHGLPDQKQARRIEEAASINLPIFQGEELPRFILLEGEKLHIWVYSKKEFDLMHRFVQERRAAMLSQLCNPPTE